QHPEHRADDWEPEVEEGLDGFGGAQPRLRPGSAVELADLLPLGEQRRPIHAGRRGCITHRDVNEPPPLPAQRLLPRLAVRLIPATRAGGAQVSLLVRRERAVRQLAVTYSLALFASRALAYQGSQVLFGIATVAAWRAKDRNLACVAPAAQR